ncbi:MAG TPA: serine hydrolase [Pyrinomonadaceae bacterium]|nr:serine hydrolase [Pyrinomonadaceae bacterium]
MRIAFSLLLLLPALLAQAPTTEKSAASMSASDDLEARIHRVENGLLLPVVVKGEPIVTMNLADRMRNYKTPGVSIAFINNGRIEWARGYGIREAGGNDPITVDTLFQAGSISKPVTAMAAMRLVQIGKLVLDEGVNRRLISWKVPENEFTKEKKVTLRGLLSHSAGVNVPSFIGYLSGEPVPTLVQILDGVKPANTPAIRVVQVPGTAFSYSGGGYTIVQQLLIDTQKKSFPDLMRELVFRPVKMKDSTFLQQPFPKSVTKPAAAGHNYNGEMPQGKWRNLPELAAAGLWTTPSDLALLLIELQRAQSGRSKFLSAKTVEQIFTEQKGNWGLGFSLEGTGPTRRFSHGGSTLEINSFLVAYNNTGQGVVIMTNALRGERLITEILRSIAREYGWSDFQPKEKTLVQIDPKVLADYAGQYQFEFSADYVLSISSESGNLITELKQPTSTSRATLYPSSDTTFFRRDADVDVTFFKDEKGRVTHLVFRQDGQDLRAKRIN